MEELGDYPERAPVIERDWTKGSIIGNLWSLSWPMSITGGVMMLGPTIDMIWVGKLGTAAIAGVGISGMVIMVVNSLMMGLFAGLRAMVARFMGAGDAEGANHVAQQAFVIGVVFSAFMAIIGIFLAKPILIMTGVEADVVAAGEAYMRIQLVGSITMSVMMMSQAIMQASGDALTPMKIGIGYRLFHIALCPFMVFGWWIFPRLGASGAALTNVISQGIGGAFGVWFLFIGLTRLRLTFRNFRLDGNMIWRLVRIGIPASIAGMERSFANLVLVWFVVPFGTAAVAAHSLIQRIDMFLSMPGMGFGQGSGVLAGQNLGARQPERAEKTAWLAAGLFTGAMAIGSLVTWFWAEPIVRIFNADSNLVEIASTFLRIQIVNYMAFGFVIAMTESLNGVGDTMIPMLTTLLTMWGVQVPLAYLLPRHTNLGVYGVRWGIVIAVVVRGAIYSIYFKLGRWKRKKV